MLNGVAPVLLFTFPLKFRTPLFNAIEGIPLVGDTIANAVGLPIPLYLDERVTGVYVESESKAIDVETEVQNRYDGGAPIVSQKGLNSLVTINLLASKNSVLLAALLALNDMIFARVVSREYSVSYFNGPTVVFNGLLHGFSTQTGVDDDLIRITMQISKANQKGTTPANVVSVLPKITGAVPVAGA